MNLLLSLLAIAASVEAHGFVKLFTVDGTEYPAFNPIIDTNYKAIKRIEWGWSGQLALGVGPVLDFMSPDIACRANAMAPKITAPIRAGGQIKFKWTDYFTSHKGPVMTYAGAYSPGQKLSEVQWFKFDETSYDPKTGQYGVDKLLKNNNTWTVTVPSNLKPGTYVIRHEILALHFALRGSATQPGSLNNGPESYPVCININVIGDGTAVPPTAGKFPGIYHRNDPGILTNIYYGPNKYQSPGPAVWEGAKHDPPKGPKPVVTETGYPSDPAAKARQIGISKAGESAFETIVAGFNSNFPGGGGDRTPVDGNPALHLGAPNKGKTGPLGVVPKDGSIVGPTNNYSPVGLVPLNNAGGGQAPKAKPAGSAPAAKGKTAVSAPAGKAKVYARF